MGALSCPYYRQTCGTKRGESAIVKVAEVLHFGGYPVYRDLCTGEPYPSPHNRAAK